MRKIKKCQRGKIFTFKIGLETMSYFERGVPLPFVVLAATYGVKMAQVGSKYFIVAIGFANRTRFFERI